MPFEKGDKNINREGRPLGARGMTTKIREALEKYGETKTGEKKMVMDALASQAVKMALNGDVQMIKLIWNYMDGMPKQGIDLDVKTNVNEEDRALLREIAEKLKEKDGGSEERSQKLLPK